MSTFEKLFLILLCFSVMACSWMFRYSIPHAELIEPAGVYFVLDRWTGEISIRMAKVDIRK